MKTVSERIKEKIENELRDDIIELLKPVCSRIEKAPHKDREYYIMTDGKKINWLEYIKRLEVLIFSQEIDGKVDAAIEEFMAKAAAYDPCESCRKCGENICGNDTETHRCYEPMNNQ